MHVARPSLAFRSHALLERSRRRWKKIREHFCRRAGDRAAARLEPRASARTNTVLRQRAINASFSVGFYHGAVLCESKRGVNAPTRIRSHDCSPQPASAPVDATPDWRARRQQLTWLWRQSARLSERSLDWRTRE